jgi:hypothetical protein
MNSSSLSSPRPQEIKLRAPLPRWGQAIVWLGFVLSSVFLAALAKDSKGGEQKVLLSLDLGDFHQELLVDLLGNIALLAAAGWAAAMGLKVLSGGPASRFAACWWPGLFAGFYFLSASPVHPDVERGLRQVPHTDFGHYLLYFCAAMIALLHVRRFLAICVEGGARLAPPQVRPSRWVLALAAVVALTYGTAHTANSYVRWKHHKIYATDTGIYDQMVYMFTQGKFFHVPVYVTNETNMADYDDNFNAEHYMPTMIIFAPFYFIWAHPMWLWIGQHFSIGLCAVLLCFLGARVTGSPWLGLATGVAFVADRLVNRASVEDFHPDALVPFFLFAMLIGYHARRFILFGVSMALLMGLKEDLSFFVALIGIFVIVDQRDWRWGSFMLMAGLFWHVVASKFIIEPLRAGDPMRVLERYAWLHPQYDYFNPWKTTPKGVGQLIRYFLFPGGERPESFAVWTHHAAHLWIYSTADQNRLLVFIKLFGPLFCLALLRPATLIFLGPLTAAHFFSGGWYDQSVFGRYHGVGVTPFYIYAGLLGIQRLLHGRIIYSDAAAPNEVRAEDATGGHPFRRIFWGYERGPSLWRKNMEFPAIQLTSTRQIALSYGLALAICVQAVMTYKIFSEGPWGGRWDRKLFYPHAHYARAQEAYDLIPAGAVVAVQNKHVPHFTHQYKTYLFPDIRPDATHILLDTVGHAWPYTDNFWPWPANPWPYLETKPTFKEFVHWLMTNGEWAALTDASFDGIMVLERGGDTSRNAEILQGLDELGYEYYRDTAERAKR